jgi:hypothetical protein
MNTLLSLTGSQATPDKYYETLRVQFRNAYDYGSLNRILQSTAEANGVHVSVGWRFDWAD